MKIVSKLSDIMPMFYIQTEWKPISVSTLN